MVERERTEQHVQSLQSLWEPQVVQVLWSRVSLSLLAISLAPNTHQGFILMLGKVRNLKKRLRFVYPN